MSTDKNENISVKEALEKRTYTVSEISFILQIGKSKAYELCKQDLFQTIRIGRSVRISKASFDNWFNNQTK